MAFEFNTDLSPQPHRRPSEIVLDGEDVLCHGGEMMETKSGDIATVSGVQAARQSVVRELPANPGSLPRRQDWGGGLEGMLMKGATSSVRDRMVSRARARLLANPRIVKVHEVSTTSEEGVTTLNVRADTISGFLDTPVVIKPPGVR